MKGDLVSACWCRVRSVSLENYLIVPSWERMSSTEFRFVIFNLYKCSDDVKVRKQEEYFCRQWPSTKYEITCPRHLRDPYENQMVEVCESSIDGSGEGLRLKTDALEGTVVAYYHGLRMPAADGHIFGKPTGTIFKFYNKNIFLIYRIRNISRVGH